SAQTSSSISIRNQHLSALLPFFQTATSNSSISATMKFSVLPVIALAATAIAVPNSNNGGSCDRKEVCCGDGLTILGIHIGGLLGDLLGDLLGSGKCHGGAYCCDDGCQVGSILDLNLFHCTEL
ncbi:hypothetical protein TOPH_05312, partial [Tolypocladium ophioglossoides CBS 100239]